MTTYGRVTDVRLQLGDDVYYQPFYLIDGMPGDVLVDADFLLRTDAFRKYQNLISVSCSDSEVGTGTFLAVTYTSKKTPQGKCLTG